MSPSSGGCSVPVGACVPEAGDCDVPCDAGGGAGGGGPAMAAAQKAAPTHSQCLAHINLSGRGSRIRGLLHPIVKFNIVLQHVHGVSRTLIRGRDNFQIIESRLTISYCNGALTQWRSKPKERAQNRRGGHACRGQHSDAGKPGRSSRGSRCARA